MSEKNIRITKSQRFEDIIAMLNDKPIKYGTDIATATDFLKNEINLLSRKNKSGSKKLTTTQIQNEEYKKLILKFLAALPEDSEGVTCAEIEKGVPELNGKTTSKISALMRALKNEDLVKKEEVKGRSLFHLAENQNGGED